MDKGRYDRQELLFGQEGQAKLEALTVAIVGLGGLGSHVAQQLAYLGVKSYVLVDKDIATKTNLNRLIGATEAHVERQALKVDIAWNMIQSILPEATVATVANSFITYEAFMALETADVVFGCVDHDGARLILNEFCQAYGKPYFDLATDINPEDLTFGGRVLYADGRVCVSCKQLLDEHALRAAFSTDAQLEEEKRIYGIRRGAVGETGPAVVSLNGILASVAVTEFLVDVTGIRSAYLHLEYKGMMGILARDSTSPNFDCYYCKAVRGQGSAADVEHYIREGWADRWIPDKL